MGNALAVMKETLKFIDVRMGTIDQISLEDDTYNDLYLALRDARNAMMRAMRAQYDIDKKEEEMAFFKQVQAEASSVKTDIKHRPDLTDLKEAIEPKK
jgi:hypothetical protein